VAGERGGSGGRPLWAKAGRAPHTWRHACWQHAQAQHHTSHLLLPLHPVYGHGRHGGWTGLYGVWYRRCALAHHILSVQSSCANHTHTRYFTLHARHATRYTLHHCLPHHTTLPAPAPHFCCPAATTCLTPALPPSHPTTWPTSHAFALAYQVEGTRG